MGFKEVRNLDSDTAIAIGGFNKKERKDNPTTVEGYFLGTKEVDSKLSASGKASLHILETPKGNLGVWGKTNMNQKLTSVPLGSKIRITFTGTQPSKKGQDMYLYKVEVDASDTIEVSPPTSSLKTESYDSNPNAEFDRQDDYSDEEEEDDTPAAAPPASAQQNRVKDLLNKARSKSA